MSDRSAQATEASLEPTGGPNGNAAPLLELTDVSVKYGPLTAVRDIALTVNTGEVVTILGANGAGKSTTLNAIVGLVPTAGGKVVFEGHEITSAATETIVRDGVALVPEGRKVFPTLTAGGKPATRCGHPEKRRL